MLFFMPPHAFSAEYLEEFKKEFDDAGQVMHGSGGMDDYATVQEWLDDRPWSRTNGNFVFFTWDNVEERIIGCVRISLHMVPGMVTEHGFNVGYSIRPSMQGQGYGNRQFRTIMEFLKSFGPKTFMVAADEDNVASWKIIEKFGGQRVDAITDGRVYTIDLSKEV